MNSASSQKKAETFVAALPKITAAAEAAGDEMMAAITKLAQTQIKRQRVRVELRLLAGENRVEVPYLPGVKNGRTLVYIVPEWRAQPFCRLRIEWRRWCWRRSKAGLLDDCESA